MVLLLPKKVSLRVFEKYPSSLKGKKGFSAFLLRKEAGWFSLVFIVIHFTSAQWS